MFDECGGEMSMDQFSDRFSALMGLSAEHAQNMFLKIDYNNDGGISWDEFSSFILALGNAPTGSETSEVTISLQMQSKSSPCKIKHCSSC